MASRIRGVNKLRRTLRRIDPEITDGVRSEIADAAEAIRLDAIAGAPVDEGDLVRSISAKVGRDGLTAVIGPGARGVDIVQHQGVSPFGTRSTNLRISKRSRHDLFQFFKAYWYEYGTKGVPEKNIPPQPARPFMGPAWDANRGHFLSRVRAAVDAALTKASGNG